MKLEITPNCRYGHGDLTMISNQKIPNWGYVNVNDAYQISVFSGDLYVCLKCGYTELFDNDIVATKSNEVQNERA